MYEMTWSTREDGSYNLETNATGISPAADLDYDESIQIEDDDIIIWNYKTKLEFLEYWLQPYDALPEDMTDMEKAEAEIERIGETLFWLEEKDGVLYETM